MSREQHYAALHYRVVTQIGATFYTARVNYPPHPDVPCAKRKETTVCCPDCNTILKWKSMRRYHRKPVDIWGCSTCKRLFAILDDSKKALPEAESRKKRRKIPLSETKKVP